MVIDSAPKPPENFQFNLLAAATEKTRAKPPPDFTAALSGARQDCLPTTAEINKFPPGSILLLQPQDLQDPPVVLSWNICFILFIFPKKWSSAQDKGVLPWVADVQHCCLSSTVGAQPPYHTLHPPSSLQPTHPTHQMKLVMADIWDSVKTRGLWCLHATGPNRNFTTTLLSSALLT